MLSPMLAAIQQLATGSPSKFFLTQSTKKDLKEAEARKYAESLGLFYRRIKPRDAVSSLGVDILAMFDNYEEASLHAMALYRLATNVHIKDYRPNEFAIGLWLKKQGYRGVLHFDLSDHEYFGDCLEVLVLSTILHRECGKNIIFLISGVRDPVKVQTMFSDLPLVIV